MPVNSIFDGPILCILIEVFSSAHAKGGGRKLKDFQVWHFYWSFFESHVAKHGSERVKYDTQRLEMRMRGQ